MENQLPVDGFHHIGIVVKDYRTYLENFSRFFGIRNWEIRRENSKTLGNLTLHGKPASGSFVSATGKAGKIAFELCQPLDGDSIFREHLEARGEGMHHVLLSMCPAEQFKPLLPWLESEGITVGQSATLRGEFEDYYLDSAGQLGTTIEVLCPPNRVSHKEPPKPDEIISFDERVASAGRVPVEKFYHVCVVTKSRRLSVRDNFQRLLGVNRWFDFDNQVGVTSQNAHYFGKAASTRFRLSLGRREQFAVEVVENVYGPTIYRDMLESQGEGLHHVMTTLCSLEEFEAARRWLEAEGMPIIQDGEAPDFCYYCYADGREKLAGLYIELLCPLGDDWLKGREDVGEILIGPEY